MINVKITEITPKIKITLFSSLTSKYYFGNNLFLKLKGSNMTTGSDSTLLMKNYHDFA